MQLTLTSLFDAPPPSHDKPAARTSVKPAPDAYEQALKAARLAAHKAVDRLWNDCNRRGSWGSAFHRVARGLGLEVDECEVSCMDIQTCNRVVAWVEGLGLSASA